jgi:2-polyprenyl-3-methyl-5-hydroxy-6-metoxy-1,4-benzoquinol methylase
MQFFPKGPTEFDHVLMDTQRGTSQKRMMRYITDRATYIVEQCRGKRVLHLGCTDWPWTEERIKIGILLHPRINESASFLMGVDADPAGVEAFRKLGFLETHVDNVEVFSNPAVRKQTFDVIVAGEIIEHLENPGLFLRAVQKMMSPSTELIITTVNAYCFFRFVYYILGRELVHPDHNYYFSPIVLRKLITRCGLEVTEFRYYRIGTELRDFNPRKLIFLDDLSRNFFPHASDGVIFKARIPSIAQTSS